MNTKLILVEGIPGSGKSLYAQRIAEFYIHRGFTVNLYNEGGFHPADLAWNACLPIEKSDSILAPYESFRKEIDINTHIEDDYAIISYTQVNTDIQDFFKAMESYEVYDNRVPFEVFNKLHLKRWSEFSQLAKHRDELTVFECAFLQNHVNELMLWNLADFETIKQHLNTLILTVIPISPVLVYLSQSDVGETISRVAKERVFENETWIDGFVHYIENTPYGKLHNVEGLNGIVQFLQKRQSVEMEIIKTLPIQTFVFENYNYDWESLWMEVENKLPV